MSTRIVERLISSALAPDVTQGGKTKADAAAFAEVLRLEMLRNALTPTEGPEADTASSRVSDLLLSLLAEGGAPVASAEPREPVTHAAGGDARVDAVVAKASQTYGVDSALIKAVIQVESGSDPRAVSAAGAQGLMQLMPETAKSLGVTDPFDPEQNVMAGTRFLKELLNRYRGNLDTALAAYNWGPGNMDRGGAPPRETREYLARVKRRYRDFVG